MEPDDVDLGADMTRRAIVEGGCTRRGTERDDLTVADGCPCLSLSVSDVVDDHRAPPMSTASALANQNRARAWNARRSPSTRRSRIILTTAY